MTKSSASSVPSEKVPLINKLAFGAGDLGPAIASGIMGFFILYFLTDVAGLSPGAASIVLLIGKIWDSVNDPIVGYLSDRIRTRWGRRRPWFLFGAIPFGITFFLFWLVPDTSATGKFWYYLIVSMMLDIAFTVVNVPYTALSAEMTSDYDERTSLTSFRFAFSIAGGLIAAVLHPIIVGMFDNVRQGYMVSAAIWSTVATIPFFFAFWGTYEHHTSKPEHEMGFVEGFMTTFKNRAFRYAVMIYLLSWMVVQTVSVIIIYYVNYWLRRPSYTSLIILAVQGSAFIWLPIWNKLSRRWGKQGVYYVGMSFWVAMAFALFFLPPDAPLSLILTISACTGAGVATAYLVPWALLPDVIELDELETGQRREGAYFGFFVLLQKFGVALGVFLVGQVLQHSGYITPPINADPLTITQPNSALTAIRWMIGPIPAVILLLGMLMVYLFPITRQQHAATLAELARRRGE